MSCIHFLKINHKQLTLAPFYTLNWVPRVFICYIWLPAWLGVHVLTHVQR